MAKIIKSDGTEKDVKPADGKHFQLEECQAIVGGYIEVVRCRDARHCIICNEEGKLRGLPLNRKATALLGGGHIIVGDVLYCKVSELD